MNAFQDDTYPASLLQAARGDKPTAVPPARQLGPIETTVWQDGHDRGAREGFRAGLAVGVAVGGGAVALLASVAFVISLLAFGVKP